MSKLDWSKRNAHAPDPARVQQKTDFVTPDRIVVRPTKRKLTPVEKALRKARKAAKSKGMIAWAAPLTAKTQQSVEQTKQSEANDGRHKLPIPNVSKAVGKGNIDPAQKAQIRAKFEKTYRRAKAKEIAKLSESSTVQVLEAAILAELNTMASVMNLLRQIVIKQAAEIEKLRK
jgi:hypothetical protein